MKKLFIIAAAALMFTACSKDSEVVPSGEKNDNTAIGFQVLNKNMSRATYSAMESVGHYNFGVWAYKDSDTGHEIMANYLVGYFGTNVGYKKLSGTTNGGLTYTDPTSTVSDWGYEGLGTSQYTHASNSAGENFYTTAKTKYMSNNKYQYLRYWDLAANHVNFYAYAPYINSATAPVTYDNGNHTMTFPVGSIVDGYDDASLYEYMYAAKKVTTTNFNQAVQLSFNRMNAKVNIAFYEVVDGYSVTIENLEETSYQFISANPAKSGTTNTYSNGLYKTNGSTIKFGGTDFVDATVTPNISGAAVYADNEYLQFKLPKVHGAIATTKDDALKANSEGGKKDESYSQTTYYAIPKNNDTGLTFRLSFTLTSDTGETIRVNNAAVFVPNTNCNWLANKAYTYVFKITKNATGTTKPGTIDPSDPTIPGNALFPIVFDNCTVEDWETATESVHPIN